MTNKDADALRKLSDGVARAVAMLRIAGEHCQKYAPGDHSFYDDADCDGYCIMEDCNNAADDLEHRASLTVADGDAEARGYARGIREAAEIVKIGADEWAGLREASLLMVQYRAILAKLGGSHD